MSHMVGSGQSSGLPLNFVEFIYKHKLPNYAKKKNYSFTKILDKCL